MNHESKRLFFESTAARRMRPTSRPQRAFSVVSSQWFKRWTRRDHSDAPDRVNSNALSKGNAPDRVNSNDRDKVNAPGRVNSNDRDKVNAPDKASALTKGSGPGGWTERVAVDRA